MRRNLTILVGLVVAATLTVRAYYGRDGETASVFVSEEVTRGSIVSTVAATGTLEAVTTVQVGSQVSGSIESLNADFNSLVRKGQLLARLDQSLYRSAVEQAQANLTRAAADYERTRVMLADAETKLARATELAARQLISANDLDAAELTRATTESQVKSAQAGVQQARASLSQAQVNLAKTVITSPIDGIVISRDVDVGQTVAASLQAPTLFVLAADLTRMQLKANIDESDLGAIQEGQPVRFTVDAYPGESFAGAVEQVRLNPVVQSNVVTYAAIISAPNPELKLKPGMTASLTIETARRENVLRVPASAVRFRPTTAVLETMGIKAPRPGQVVWHDVAGTVQPVEVRLGLTDGSWTELVEAPLDEGARVVTRMAAPGTAAQPAASSGSPLMGPQRRR